MKPVLGTFLFTRNVDSLTVVVAEVAVVYAFFMMTLIKYSPTTVGLMSAEYRPPVV